MIGGRIFPCGLVSLSAGTAFGAVAWAARPVPNYYSVALFAAATVTLLTLARLIQREA